MADFKTYHKYKEMIHYIIAGGLTTIVNLLTFFILDRVVAIHYVWADVLAVTISILFAYWINRTIIFHSTKRFFKEVLKEFTSFVSFRMVTAFLELALLIILVEWLVLDTMFSKIIVQILVTVSNYIFSKFIIFKK